MDSIWKSVLDFFAKASADLVLKAIAALVMLFVGFRLIKAAMRMVEKTLAKSKLDTGLQGFLASLASIALRAMLCIVVLMYLGIPAASFIALLTSLGLAVGLALQGSLSNFAGGLMILVFRPFRTGDYIKTDNADGTVQAISMMYTTLKTLDGKKVVIPNAMLSNGVITDFTWYETRRVDLSVTVGFEHDADQVRGLLQAAADNHPAVLSDPPPAAFLEKMQDGAQVFTLRCWVKTADWWDSYLALTREVKDRLQASGISIAAPLRDVRQR